MRIREVAGRKYLVGLNFLQEVVGNVYIGLGMRLFLHCTRFVEGEVLEVCVSLVHAAVSTGRQGLTFPYKAFEVLYFGTVYIPGLLGVQEGPDLLELLLKFQIVFLYICSKVEKANDLIVEHGYIT